jgi:hypothetical protein
MFSLLFVDFKVPSEQLKETAKLAYLKRYEAKKRQKWHTSRLFYINGSSADGIPPPLPPHLPNAGLWLPPQILPFEPNHPSAFPPPRGPSFYPDTSF